LATVAPVITNIDDVAPPITVPFFSHCKVGVGEPVAATVSTTVLPLETVFEIGCNVNTGTDPETPLTVKVAALLVAAPNAFVATQR
jgi:hypothetical protein